MRRPATARSATTRLTRRDWYGDAVLTLIGGISAVAAVFLPWANEETGGLVNFAFTTPQSIRGVLGTPWGWPALTLALLVVGAGAAMLLLGPRRHVGWLGLLVALAGVGIAAVAADGASAVYTPGTTGGLGIVVALFAGALLVPIGLASCLVAYLLQRRAREETSAADRSA
jgi:hypothetical protein